MGNIRIGTNKAQTTTIDLHVGATMGDVRASMDSNFQPFLKLLQIESTKQVEQLIQATN